MSKLPLNATRKVRAHLRIARTQKGNKIEASAKPNYEPLSTAVYGGGKDFLPTIFFAVDFEIPEILFTQAENVVALVNLSGKGEKIDASFVIPE